MDGETQRLPLCVPSRLDGVDDQLRAFHRLIRSFSEKVRRRAYKVNVLGRHLVQRSERPWAPSGPTNSTPTPIHEKRVVDCTRTIQHPIVNAIYVDVREEEPPADHFR